MTKRKPEGMLRKKKDTASRCEACGIELNHIPTCETDERVYHNRTICAYCYRIWKKDEDKWLHHNVSFEDFMTRVAGFTILQSMDKAEVGEALLRLRAEFKPKRFVVNPRGY